VSFQAVIINLKKKRIKKQKKDFCQKASVEKNKKNTKDKVNLMVPMVFFFVFLFFFF